jgi:hypothetical protein
MKPSALFACARFSGAALLPSIFLAVVPSTDAASFTDIPSREINISVSQPAVPSQDSIALAAGKPDGELGILMIEDARIKSRHSPDGGTTWGSEVEVSGPGQPDVKIGDAVLSPDGKVYCAWVAVNTAGDLGLRFARSDDLGQTWTAPVTLVGSGAPSSGVGVVNMAAGGPGIAALIYRGNEARDPFVIATADGGGTWTSPVRIDSGVPMGSTGDGHEQIAIDSSGRIFAAYRQDRGAGDTIFYTRSTDGGVSFAAEQPLSLPSHHQSHKPALQVTNDGNVLIALWDDAGSNHIFVMRSTDHGQTYTNVLDRTLAGDGVKIEPKITVDPATAVTFVGWVRSSNALVVDRSANSGATWGADQVIATTSANPDQTFYALFGLLRTSAGNWVIGWTDQRSDGYAHTLTDVYARSSTDGGVTWGTEQRVDGGVAGSHVSALTGGAANGTDSIFFLYRDGRDDNERSFNFYGNRSAAATLTFGPDARVDGDDGTVPPFALDQVDITTDGAAHAYVAFPAFTTGPQSDIFVAVSADSGHTFGIPVRVGSTAAGTRISQVPEVRALSDGNVYLVYMSDNPVIGREIRFNHSSDYGTTWQPTDTVLATLGQPSGYFVSYNWPGTVLRELSDAAGTVYVAWSDGANVDLAVSHNHGATFSTSDVDQDGRGRNRYPRICVHSSLVVLTWQSPNVAQSAVSLWGVVSNDKGTTWSVSKELRSDAAAGSVDLHSLACDSAGHAVVVWPDPRNLVNYALYSSRFDGTNWSGEVALTGPPSTNELLPMVVYPDASTAIVVYEDEADGIYASRSTDDGATFPNFQRLDASAPVPGAGSYLGRATTDGSGHVWAYWLDQSAGVMPSLVVRHSGDSGATYGGVYRLDRKTPQGGYQAGNLLGDLNFVQSSLIPPYTPGAATFPGVALFGWAAERESLTLDALVNAYDVNDFDRDGAAGGSDCNDSNADVQHPPVEVAGITLSKLTGATRLAWNSQDPTAGAATTYDVVTGLLSALRSSGGFAGATCLADGVRTPLDDTRGAPAAGDGFYYLARAKNPCGTATYGSSGHLPDPRTALDTSSPCP